MNCRPLGTLVLGLLPLFAAGNGCAPAAPVTARVHHPTPPPAPERVAPVEPARPELTSVRAAWTLTCTAEPDGPYASFCTIRDIAGTADGGFIFAGEFWGTVRLAGERMVGRAMPLALLVRVDAEGKLLWVRRFGKSWHNYFNQVAVSDDGLIYVSGRVANGFHPSLPRRPDPMNVGDAERSIVGVLSPDGEWISIRERDENVDVVDLAVTARGVLTVDRRGVMNELTLVTEGEGKKQTRRLEPVQLADLHLEDPPIPQPPDSCRVGDLAFDRAGGLWRVYDCRRGGQDSIEAAYYHGEDPARVHVLGPKGFSASVRMAVGADARVAVADLDYLSGPELRLRWWFVSAQGGLQWEDAQTLAREREYSPKLLEFGILGDSVLTLLGHGDGLVFAGHRSTARANAPNDYPVASVISSHDIESGRLESIAIPDDPCTAASFAHAWEFHGFSASGRLFVASNTKGCDPEGGEGTTVLDLAAAGSVSSSPD